jgi:uncharacterized protein (TIGR02246 family)
MPATTPEECDALFEQLMNSADIEAVVALYEPDGVLITAPGQLAQGTDAIRGALQGILAMKPQFKLVVKNVVTAGDIAVVYNDWTGSMGDEGARVEISGKAMEICRRQPDGTWRFVIDDPYARD